MFDFDLSHLTTLFLSFVCACLTPLQVDGCLLESLPPVVVRNASGSFSGTVSDSSIDEGIEAEDEQSIHLSQCGQTLSEGTSQLGTVSATGLCVYTQISQSNK